jgi:hypothetical protein
MPEGSVGKLGSAMANLSSDATSMIRGMSREKPALDLVRCIEYAWSLYESTGDKMRNAGVRYPDSVVNQPMLPIRPCR